MAYLTAVIVMTLNVLEGHSLLQAFSCEIFHICGASHGSSASAELLVKIAPLYDSIANLQKMPPYLKCVTTLPCDISGIFLTNDGQRNFVMLLYNVPMLQNYQEIQHKATL